MTQRKTADTRMDSRISPAVWAGGGIALAAALFTRLRVGSPLPLLHLLNADSILPPLWLTGLCWLSSFFLSGCAAGFILNCRTGGCAAAWRLRGAVYGLLCLFGKPQQVVGFSDMIRGDIDGAGTILAKYPDMIAEVEYSKITNSKVPSEIQGEKGIMLIHEINCLENVKIIYNDGTEEVVYFRNKENNMKYELEHFIRMVHGQEQNQLHTQRSLDAIELMDEIRRQCHISFPADK